MSSEYKDIHQPLVRKAMNGDSKALHELYKLYSRAMYNTCCRILNNEADAEDMLQEIFIEAFSKLNSFRFESTFGAWLKRITVNRCINELRKRKLALEYQEILQEPNPEELEEPDQEDIELSVERIRHAMALLPDGYRVIFSLYMLEGYDHEEIASILNISESTSKTQLMRAKKRIIDILNVGKY